MKRGFKAAAVKDSYQSRDMNFISPLRTKKVPHCPLLKRENNTKVQPRYSGKKKKKEVGMLVESPSPTQAPS